MNNRYFTTLFCLTILALAPACTKRQEKAAPKQDDVNTMIEVDNDIFEIEEEIEIKKSIIKF